MKIDLNCDMGESFGRYALGNDESIMPFITSANIACGLHAGDPLVMGRTIRLAKQYGVAVGAHPGWPDLQGFGRREMSLSAEETEAFVLYQIGALAAFAKSESVELHHIKPHGALYNQAVKDRAIAGAIASAAKRFSVDLILVGLAGSGLVEAGVEAGLRVAQEGFPDRNYNPDGTLVSRKQINAIIESPQEVAAHAVRLVQDGIEFGDRRVRVDTLCLHGDHPKAEPNAKIVRDALEKSGVEIAPP
ncbi:MAG TPA: 5-oxoprolinase subunit PxpA [Anaerolineales bacterium]|nr:5-oxoprolinase subunit PxpA [Anaerolineales bacterium]